MKKLLIVNGPNLNLLGTREPEVYGTTTLDEILKRAGARAASLGLAVESFQSNNEGDIVTRLQQAGADESVVGIVINPAAYTHTSVAIRDVLAAIQKPKIEVHLSNIYAREAFRKESFVSPVVSGVISGLGAQGYELAVEAVSSLVKKP